MRLAKRAWGATAAFLGAALLASPCPGWAQAPLPAEKPPLSVYQISPVTDGVILGATALFDLYPLLNGYHFIAIRPEVDERELIPWDRHVVGNQNAFANHLSNATVAVAMAAPVLLDYLDVGWGRVLAEDLVVYAQTLAINSAVTSLFKFTVQRPLPLVYSGDYDASHSPGGYQSFYSGHTSTTFAALSAASLTLNLRHDTGVWPWVATVAIGTSVAIERVAAGQHFYTDVVVGGLMGTAVGVLVPWLHKREQEGKPALTLLPAPDGAQLAWTRRF